jgi:hypothetical protein
MAAKQRNPATIGLAGKSGKKGGPARASRLATEQLSGNTRKAVSAGRPKSGNGSSGGVRGSKPAISLRYFQTGPSCLPESPKSSQGRKRNPPPHGRVAEDRVPQTVPECRKLGSLRPVQSRTTWRSVFGKAGFRSPISTNCTIGCRPIRMCHMENGISASDDSLSPVRAICRKRSWDREWLLMVRKSNSRFGQGLVLIFLNTMTYYWVRIGDLI